MGMVEGVRSNNVAQGNSLIVKAGKGRLFRVHGFNALAGTQFFQVHDAAAVPADTAVPLIVISLAASSPFSLDFMEIGLPCVNGIVLCNSTTGPTKTIGAANCLITAIYA